MTLGEFVDRALLVPFVPRGRAYDGWDCWGLVYCAYRDVLGVELPRYDDSYDDADVGRGGTRRLAALVASQVMTGDWVPVAPAADRPWAAATPTDVAVFRLAGRPLHVGLVTGAGVFLHSEEKIGTVVERFTSPMWAKRLEGVYRRVG